MEYGAAQARGVITLNSLKDQQYSLNMQILLAIQNNDRETQAKLEEQSDMIENRIRHMKTRGSHSTYIASGGILR